MREMGGGVFVWGGGRMEGRNEWMSEGERRNFLCLVIMHLLFFHL